MDFPVVEKKYFPGMLDSEYNIIMKIEIINENVQIGNCFSELKISGEPLLNTLKIRIAIIENNDSYDVPVFYFHFSDKNERKISLYNFIAPNSFFENDYFELKNNDNRNYHFYDDYIIPIVRKELKLLSLKLSFLKEKESLLPWIKENFK